MNNTNEKQDLLSKNPRWVSAQILTRIERTDSYLDKLIENEFRSNRLNEKDKRLLNEITNGVIRNKMRIDWVLKKFYHGDFLKINSAIKNSLRVALYQFLFCDKIPEYAIVNEAVESIKISLSDKHSKLVNAVLRNILRQKDKIEFPDPEKDRIKYLSVFYSHPEWMVKRWVNRLGYDSTEALLVMNNKPKDISVRINALKMTRDMAEIEMLAQKVKFERSDYSDVHLNIKNFGELNSLELMKNGTLYVQDPSASLPVQLLDPQEGERIIDICAAPGGKATHIAEKMKNTGEIIAVDIFDMRLKTVEENFKRLGITNIKTLSFDARTLAIEPGDRVLVDAPCSGFGTLSKKPDIKWKQDPAQLEKLGQLQYEIIVNASRHVKPDGVLVYSTCTIEPEENSEIVEKFLASHTNFVLESADKFVLPDVVSEKGYIETYPHIHHIDGSFSARLKRIF